MMDLDESIISKINTNQPCMEGLECDQETYGKHIDECYKDYYGKGNREPGMSWETYLQGQEKHETENGIYGKYHCYDKYWEPHSGGEERDLAPEQK